jgi:hypothetical protein
MVQLRPPGQVGLLAHGKSSTDPQNLGLPLRKPPCGGIPLPRALLAPRRAPPAPARRLHPRFAPGLASPTAQAQATTPPLAPIKAHQRPLSSSPPTCNSGESLPAHGHTTPPPHCPNQPFHQLLRLNPRLHSRSPRHLPHRTVAPTIRTRRRLCATIGRPPRSTPSPPKTSNMCGLFPSYLSLLHPSPPATLVAGFWPAVAISLCKGPFCFDFNLSEKFSIKSQGLIYKPGIRTLKTNLLTL